MGQYFIPNTTVYIFAGTDIDENNKPFITSMQNFRGWLGTFKNYAFNNYSYQRADDRQYIAVDMDYNEAIQCDLLIWNNQEHEPERWYVANITGVEFKNPNTTWIYFEIDAYCTFGEDIEWDTSISFVEREHVDNDWNGDVPNFVNMGVQEGLNPTLEKTYYMAGDYFTSLQFIVRDPFWIDESGKPKPQYYPGGYATNMFAGLNIHAFDTQKEVSDYLNLVQETSGVDINQVLDIITIPRRVTIEFLHLNPPWKQVTYNNAKCFSSEFCIFATQSYLGTQVTWKPELFSDHALQDITFIADPGSFNKGLGGYLLYPNNGYLGTQGVGGKKYAFTIKDWPHGSWTSNYFQNWASMNMLPEMIKTAGSLGTAGYGLFTGNPYIAVHGAMSLLQQAGNVSVARNKGSQLSGEFSSTNPNFAASIDELDVIINALMPIDATMKYIDTYFDRFGYKVMQLKVPNVHTRAYWNYVKTIEGHVDGDIPFFYRKKIEDMLNNGVTFWNIDNGRIGNFSNPAKNKEAITQ